MTPEQLKDNFKKIEDEVREAALKVGRNPDEITILAVSKTHPIEYIKIAVQAGITKLGENYAQELRDKHAELEQAGEVQPEWHFIGHLQRNKVKYLAPFVKLIHSVDSFKLAKEIDKEAAKNNRKIDILLQVNTSGELSKSGCEAEDAISEAARIIELENVSLRGAMTIGSLLGDDEINLKEFRMLRKIRDDINSELRLTLAELSMGMTSDFPLAIAEGSTIIRIGTAIFGARDYK